MTNHVIKVGIISKENYINRTISMARGTYKPKKGEPKIWFDSLRSLAEALSSDNQELLRIIVEKKPNSLAELEAISGRKKSNLSRTLKMLESYGIVSINKVDHKLIPKVNATDFKVEFGINLYKNYAKEDNKNTLVASGF